MSEFVPTSRYPDAFDSLNLRKVAAEHYPQGIEYWTIQPEGMPPLTMEIGVSSPPSTSAESKNNHAIIVPPGFGTRMRKNGIETHHALRHAHLARVTGQIVLALGFPDGEGVDSLPEILLQEVRKGNFAPYTDYLAEIALQKGIETFDVDGFSLGGAVTADLVLSCAKRGLEARRLMLGAIANADTEIGALSVFGRYSLTLGTQKERNLYAQSSLALKEELYGRPKTGLVPSVADKLGSILRPTPFAFAMGMGHGTLLARSDGHLEFDPIKKLEAVKNLHDDIEIYLYSGTKDTLVPIRVMRSIARVLDLPLHEFKDETHALRDKLAVVGPYITDIYKAA